MKPKTRIPADGEPIAWKSPFAGLKDVVLPPVPPRDPVHQPGAPQSAPAKNRGRVDIIRQTAHRGGKTVTVITGFDGRIEIQGDRRDDVARILTKAGFRPVFAGG